MNKMAVGTQISIITLRENRLNAPIKKDWLNGYKNKICIVAAYQGNPSDLNIHIDRKCGEWKKVFHTNGNQMKATVSTVVSDNIHFK